MLNEWPNRPDISDTEALKLLDEVYGIIGSLNELPSERDQNFHVKTEKAEEYVLKIANTFEKEAILDFQNKTMLHLAMHANFGNYPLVLRTKTLHILQQVHDLD